LSPNERVVVRAVADDEHGLWARVAAEGWSHLPELTAFMHELAIVNAKRQNHVSFLAEIDGQPIAAGGVALIDGVALLAGASTIPSARKQGAQRALLEARLHHAAAHGCDIAMIGAAPGSDSQRNAERQGFRIAYTRVKWRKDFAPAGA
jgi:GNAT superfamily N-acetyltransferase